jgi:hypothetical protein
VKERIQLIHKQFLLRFGCALTAVIFTLIGCAPSTGYLGMVTGNKVDSVLLLKSGQKYTEVGPRSRSLCFDSNSRSFRPPDNFADVLEGALNSSEADALIDVTVTTHRGNYFPVWGIIPIPPIGAVPFAFFPWSLCTTVSGTAIRIMESPNCNPCVVARKPPRAWLQPEDSRGTSGEVVSVTSFQPTLQWEPFSSGWEDTTYDLIVWRAKTGWREVRAESIVYERERLDKPSHRIEATLEPATHYLWAVRAHFTREGQTQVTRWSYELTATAPDKPHYYQFWTPDSCDLAQ